MPETLADNGANRTVNPVILARAKELRRPMTPHEAKLWQRLRGKQFYAIKFRRQHPIYRFILDFFCYQHHPCGNSGNSDVSGGAGSS